MLPDRSSITPVRLRSVKISTLLMPVTRALEICASSICLAGNRTSHGSKFHGSISSDVATFTHDMPPKKKKKKKTPPTHTLTTN
jgi:hypothetical protein